MSRALASYFSADNNGAEQGPKIAVIIIIIMNRNV